MRLTQRLLERADLIAMAFLVTFPWILFWSATTGQGVFFDFDVSIFWYPTLFDYAHALAEGRLPLWTPGMGAGFPLLAEGQIAALYPPNLVLYHLLPVPFALTYSVLLHLSWAGVGMFLLARSSRLSTASATLAGWAFASGGFFLSHVLHLSLLATASWLPWIIYLQQRYRVRAEAKGKRLRFILVSVALGLQLLSGFPQIALLNLLAFSLTGVFDLLSFDRPRIDIHTCMHNLFQTVLWVVLGFTLAAVQLLPTAELVTLSTRMATTQGFFSSYALFPAQLAQFISPFAVLNVPTEPNMEYWGYIGTIPLILALLAPVLRPHWRTWGLLLFGLVALSFTLGETNPLYRLLYLVPLFNRFRAPARYLLLFSFAAALLAAIGLDELRSRLSNSAFSIRSSIYMGGLFGLTLVGLFVLQNHSAGLSLSAYEVLPWLFLFSGVVLVWSGLRLRLRRASLTSLLLGFSILELTLYAFPFLAILDVLVAPKELTRVPVLFSATDSADPYARIYATGFYDGPNRMLAYGKQSPQIYTPLALQRNVDYEQLMTPAMLNLLNIRYVIHADGRPLRTDDGPSASVRYDYLQDAFEIPPTETSQVEVVSYTKTTATERNGLLVGNVTLNFTNGESTVLPIRLGIETAESRYDMLQQSFGVNHTRPSTALPLYLSLPKEETIRQGTKFVARYELPSQTPLYVDRVQAQSLLWSNELTIDRISLIDKTGRSSSVAALAHLNDFRVVYDDNTLTMLENRDVMARAFIVHAAQVLSDDQMLDRLQDPTFQPDRVVLLSDGAPMDALPAPGEGDSVEITTYRPEQVILKAQTAQAGYLVLADTWFPGWTATVDGHDVQILRADHIFRAVPLGPGNHEIAFEYHPMSLAWGALISGLSVLICFAVVVLPFRW